MHLTDVVHFHIRFFNLHVTDSLRQFLEDEPAPGDDIVSANLNPLPHAFLLYLEECRRAAVREQLFLLEGRRAVMNVPVVPNDIVGGLLGDDPFQTVLLETSRISLQSAKVTEFKSIADLLNIFLLRLWVLQIVGEGDDAARSNDPSHLIHHLLSVLTVDEAVR